MRKIRIDIKDTFICSFLFVFVVAFPFTYFKDLLPSWAISLLSLSFKMFLSGYYLRIILKYNLPMGKMKMKNTLLCVPLLLACFSNLLSYIFADDVAFVSEFSWVIVIDAIALLFSVFNEEVLFRLFIYNNLNIKNKLLKILAGAGIFAGFHFLNVIGPNFISLLIPTLIQVLYTFGLGLIICLIYEYSCSLIPCFIYHFLFNFFNSFFVNYLVIGLFYNNPNMYIYAGLVIGAITFIYALFIYLFIFRKDNQTLSDNQINDYY